MNEEPELLKPLPEDKPTWPPPADCGNASPVPTQHLAVPIPTTPQSAAPVSAGLIPQEYELPPELVQQGWRKFWSKRESRPYFWNKATGNYTLTAS